MCLANCYTCHVLHNYLLNKSMHPFQMLEVQVEVIMIATLRPKLHLYRIDIFIFAPKRSVNSLPTVNLEEKLLARFFAMSTAETLP